MPKNSHTRFRRIRKLNAQCGVSDMSHCLQFIFLDLIQQLWRNIYYYYYLIIPCRRQWIRSLRKTGQTVCSVWTILQFLLTVRARKSRVKCLSCENPASNLQDSSWLQPWSLSTNQLRAWHVMRTSQSDAFRCLLSCVDQGHLGDWEIAHCCSSASGPP